VRLAFLGLSASGKTTLFNALTGAHASVGTYSGAGAEVHIGRIEVADHRLNAIKHVFKPAKVTRAVVEVVDTPPLAVAAHENREGNARLLATLREADALVLVVRAFLSERVAHPRAVVDPMRDLRDLRTELVLADLDIVEKRIGKLHREIARGNAPASDPKELAALQRARPVLEAGSGVSNVPFTAEEKKLVSSFAFLTAKPVVAVMNVGEEALRGGTPGPWSGENLEGPASLDICAEWEMEVHDLPREEWSAYLADAGIAEPCAARFVREVCRMMDLVTFFTCNENELRAWQVRRYSTAVEAAAAVHTDMARGFIRAEVIAVEDLKRFGSVKDVRTHGKERLEGKTGPVMDGDLIHFRFSV
jgi:GTP-binding protein YchF